MSSFRQMQRCRIRPQRSSSLAGVAVIFLCLIAASFALDAGADVRRRPVHPPAPLALFAPVSTAPLLSGSETLIDVPYTYSRSGMLEFQLLAGPPGMTIDMRTGVLRWTPPVSAEGSSQSVHVTVTDGVLHAEVAFAVDVARCIPLPVTITGQTLTLSDPGTLSGMAFTFPSDPALNPAMVSAWRIEGAELPVLPEGLTRLSDYFRLTPLESDAASIVFTIPAGIVPEGRSPQRVRLMVFTAEATEAKQRLWLPIWKNLDVRTDGTIAIEISTLGEAFTVAIDSESALTSFTAAEESDSASCAPLQMSNGELDRSRQVCTVAGDPPLTFVIKDRDRAAWAPLASPAEMAEWLAAASAKSVELGLFSATRLEVVAEPMSGGVLGFVTFVENFQVLHVNSSAMKRGVLQGTLAHELFHQAQSRTVIEGLDNLIRRCGRPCQWVTEGTARWFEDVVFDELDTYRSKEPEPLPPVLFPGLDAWPDSGLPATRPYARFAFFKLLSSRCPKLDVAGLVNAELRFDPTGVDELSQNLERWECHFADELPGAWHDSLAAALLEYAYATIGENSMAQLDDDEAPFEFENAYDLLHPDPACKLSGACPSWAIVSGTTPHASVSAVRVTAVEGLPDGSEAVLVLRSPRPGMVAWIGNDEEGGLSDGRWIVIGSETVVHPYSKNGRGSRLLVFLINADVLAEERIEIRSIVRSSNSGAETTPIDFKWSYHPANPVTEKSVAPFVTWDAVAQGAITAPEGVSVSTVTRPYQWANTRVMQACAPNTSAFTIQMEVTLSASSAKLEGTAQHPTLPGASIGWRYINPRIRIAQNEPTGSISGSTVSFTIPVVKGAVFGRVFGAYVAYDLETWVINADGTRTPTSTATDVSQAFFVLDLRVGSPPPGCP